MRDTFSTLHAAASESGHTPSMYTVTMTLDTTEGSGKPFGFEADTLEDIAIAFQNTMQGSDKATFVSLTMKVEQI